MPIIRKKIRLVPNPSTSMIPNIKFGISANDGFLGYQQEIDNLTQKVSASLINPPLDAEVRRISYAKSLGPLKIEFDFHVPVTTTFATSFIHAGFTTNEIIQKAPCVVNSFFIMDFFDSYNINTQTKIFTAYLTKITYGEKDGNTPIPRYEIGGSQPNQLLFWYVPKSYLTGSTMNGYVRFSFYNAKTGRVMPFYNYDNESLISSQKIFFDAVLSVSDNTWNISTPATHSKLVIARELWSSPDYSEKVDNTVANTDNKVQNYPNGSMFNSATGKYLTDTGTPAPATTTTTTTTTSTTTTTTAAPATTTSTTTTAAPATTTTTTNPPQETEYYILTNCSDGSLASVYSSNVASNYSFTPGDFVTSNGRIKYMVRGIAHSQPQTGTSVKLFPTDSVGCEDIPYI